MKSATYSQSVSKLLAAIGQTVRVRILLAIGQSEACVCHLESVLGKRQAYISQHLMAMRRAGVLVTRREGKYVYYRLADPAYLQLIHTTAALTSNTQSTIPLLEPVACNCPQCANGEQT